VANRPQGPRLKVERADEHIRELEAAIKRFHETDPYSIVREEDADTGDLLYRLRLRGLPPQRFATIAGDTVHNLQSALDLLWCQLVEANGKTIANNDIFVISDDRNKFEAAFKGVKKRISPSPEMSLLRSNHTREGITACGGFNVLT
jgi:hypothetical protein